MMTPLTICQVLVGTSIKSVDAFSSKEKPKTDALRPAMIKNGLRERDPSELRASKIGNNAITHGANTDKTPAINDINNRVIY